MLAAAAPAAAFLFLLLPLPPRAITASSDAAPAAKNPTAIGALHIHTNRSDGSGTPEDVAAAAARAGLQFIVLTDHGDGTQRPESPRYLSGVLVIDAVELSTSAGHYIAVGLDRAAPYPLRGEPRDVVEDVRRLGGFGIVAHPDSAKPSLQWRDWDVPFDAMEWLNADTAWRDEPALSLIRALVRYPVRPSETLASLLDRPDGALSRWDMLTKHRPVVALSGTDAHARLGWSDDDDSEYAREWFLNIPSYQASLRTFANHVGLDEPLASRPEQAAAQVVAALKSGRVFSAITAAAAPAALTFTASDARGITVKQGDHFALNGRISFAVQSNAPEGSVTVLRKDGRILTHASGKDVAFQAHGEHGAYRVEVTLPNAPGDPPIPWLISNPIYVHPAEWGSATAHPPPVTTDRSVIQGGPWHVEKDAASTAAFAHPSPPDGPVEFRYRLGAGARDGQYGALAISVGSGLAGRARLAFRAVASQPMRLSVQARQPRSGNRWQRSVYLDTNPRDVLIPFTGMSPMAGAATPFDPALADTLLFVVDLTNAVPGTAGAVTISGVSLDR